MSTFSGPVHLPLERSYQNGQKMSQLNELFGFTDEDLQANKRGELSAAQKRRLIRNQVGNVALAVFMLLGALLMLFAVLQRTDPLFVTVFVIGLVLLASISLLFSLRHVRRMINVDTVGTVVGSPKLSQQSHVQGDRTTYSYALTIDDHSVTVNNNIFQRLDRGGIYRLYYIPGTNTYLSIEDSQNPAASDRDGETSPPSTAPEPNRDYLPDETMDMALLVEIYMKDKPLVIPTTNDPAEDALRRGEWFKAAEKLIRSRADEARPYLANYPEHPLTTELSPDTAANLIPELMKQVASDSRTWRKVRDQIAAMPSAGLFDKVAPYAAPSQPEHVRMVAVEVVGQLDDPRRVDIMREAAQSGSMNLYQSAIYWLGEAGTGADVVAPFLESDHKPTRERAEDALFKMNDPRGLDAIRKRAYALADDGKTRAVDELVKIIDERRARRHLKRMTQSKNMHLSIAARQTITKLRRHDDETIAKWAKSVRWD
jgi:hypothetical protein